MIQVFGKPECPGCEQTKKLLDREGASYEYVDVTENQWARDVLKEHDISSVPATMSFTHQPIVGFRPDILKEVVKAYAADPSLDIEQETT
ncbi:NrdH-redoxin [Mycobacteroides chelonae]|nr:NrdH-redoxin [Mycobacteroides chelonae]OHT69443.1 NrdH-redoxin [Mycobacteroides chelonae]